MPAATGKPAYAISWHCVALRLWGLIIRLILAAIIVPVIWWQDCGAFADFEISVAAYPETHPAARSADDDLDNLKRKLDAGATRAITQYFFDTSTYLRFLERCLVAGITAPIVPGIMPVSNYAQAAKFSAMCGAAVPAWLGHMFEGTEDDAEQRRTIASIVAAEQVRVLQANGIDEFHFYTLNRPDLTYTIAHVLGVRPRACQFTVLTSRLHRSSRRWFRDRRRQVGTSTVHVRSKQDQFLQMTRTSSRTNVRLLPLDVPKPPFGFRPAPAARRMSRRHRGHARKRMG